ncbi:MAG: class I SAM-dependent rRNA methyltransferase, partial [Pleurocapsa sp. SU_196_0]|nr:class I SAM-dependent rRNA methyltransferase [Pleurocapsa sp. SU_196_0]
MTVTLSARGLERFQTGHPWIYRSDIARAPELAGLYPVRDARGRTLGWAAVNPKSEITVRLLTRGERVANEALLMDRLERALEFRGRLRIDGDSFRVVHSDADGLPGLTVDKYGQYLVVQQNSAALEPYLDAFVDALETEFAPLGILARFDGKSRGLEGLETGVYALRGSVPDWIEASEGRVRYWVDPWRGQKTGAFLDQRENRAALTARGFGRALDVFSYHASFGLHLATVCDSVDCIDASESALERAEENARLNGLDNLEFTVGNAFDLLRERERAGEKYHTISLDPPAFAKARRDLSAAYRAYKEVNLRALRLLEPGGIL